ncbi:MAG: membrane dipeptidase, partial [Clostridiaceae bacterium]|nr:membrane dipeptidase [Clostridiaceae bacterium]
LSHHIDVIVDMVGIDHIGLGLDFCDFLRSETLGIQDQEYKEIKDMPNARYIQGLINHLVKKGYREKDLEKIAYGNFLRVFKEVLI